MHKLVLLISVMLVLISSSGIAAERTWESKEIISNGSTVIFHWVGVYEGLDTVYKITNNNKILDLGAKNAAGQPNFNKNHSYLALPYCADDGCLSTVNIVELSNLNILPAINLEYKGQFYIKCKWVGSILELSVEHEPWNKKRKSVSIHKFNISQQGVSYIETK